MDSCFENDSSRNEPLEGIKKAGQNLVFVVWESLC